MTSIASQFLNQLAAGDEIRDYQHATRTFVDGLYRLSPKFKSLFHVFIDFNPAVPAPDRNSQIELGMMAKSVTLPKFNVQNKILNAYNRKNIVQERINYDPVNITFHDDSANIVRDFWANYFRYHYRDSDHEETIYDANHKYQNRMTTAWGYSPAGAIDATNYIKAIRIYSLHQKQFSAYTLIRPVITSFQHDTVTQGEYDLMTHNMTVAYEAVQYTSGAVSNNTVQGFAEIHYDKTPSPLSARGGGTTSFIGPGGLVESAGDFVKNVSTGNLGAAALGALRSYNNFKNSNLKDVAAAELAQTAGNILRGQNPQSTIFVPTAASIREGLAKAVTTLPGKQ